MRYQSYFVPTTSPMLGNPSASPPTEKYPLPLDSSLPAKVTKRCAQLRAQLPLSSKIRGSSIGLIFPLTSSLQASSTEKSLVSALSVISQFHPRASLFCRSPAQTRGCRPCSPASQLHSWSSPPSSVKLFCTSRAPHLSHQLPRTETKNSPANSFNNRHSSSNVFLPPPHDARPARRPPRPRRKAPRRHGHHQLHPWQGDSSRPAL